MSNHERPTKSNEQGPTLQDRLKKIGGRKLLVAAVIVGGLTIGGIAYVNSKSADPSNEQGQSQSSQRNEGEEKALQELNEQRSLSLEEIRADYDANTPSGEEIAESFKIPTGLSDQELADTFAKRLSEWMKCGYHSSLRDEYLHESTSRDNFVDTRLSGIAASCEKYITASIFDERYTDVSSTAGFVNGLRESHAYSLDIRVLTDDGSVENEEPYEKYFTTRKVTNITASGVDPSSRTLSFSMLEQSNVSKNVADERLGSSSTSKERGLRVAFSEESGTTRITRVVEY